MNRFSVSEFTVFRSKRGSPSKVICLSSSPPTLFQGVGWWQLGRAGYSWPRPTFPCRMMKTQKSYLTFRPAHTSSPQLTAAHVLRKFQQGPNKPLIFISSKGLEGAVEKVMFEFSWTSSIVSCQYDLDEVIFKYTLIPAHSSSHQLNEIYEVICIPHKATPSPCVRFSLMKVLGDPLCRRRSCGNINKRCGSPVLRLHGRSCIEWQWQCSRGKKRGGLLDHTWWEGWEYSNPSSRPCVGRQFAQLIISGAKKWEVRTRNTHLRGRVSIALSGSQKLLGEVTIVGSVRMTISMIENYEMHRIKNLEAVPQNVFWAWVLQHPCPYPVPIPYNHPKGAISWVRLDKTNLIPESLSDFTTVGCFFSGKTTSSAFPHHQRPGF